MTHYSLLLNVMAMFFISFSVYAVDVPSTVIGSEDYTKDMCIQQNQDTCISNLCTTSEDMDCQEKCKKMAEDKCQEQVDE